MASFINVVYDNQDRQVSWCGVKMADCDDFNAFVTEDVASRLHDKKEKAEFETHLRGLASTAFGRESLEAVFAADAPESRDWAAGEAVAEAFLSREYAVVWPWNMERDKRNPRASLPGADLAGFRVEDKAVRFVFGETKTSSDPNRPPGVMKGRSGMTNQIKNLAKDLSLINSLLRWLFSRCKNTPYEKLFNSASQIFAESGCKAMLLYGVLIRDTEPGEKDLKKSGRKLAKTISSPTVCSLFAVYIPCPIADLPARIAGGRP